MNEEESSVQLARPLYERLGWIRFLGWLLAILGGMQVVTICGALWGICPLLCGIWLIKGSDQIQRGYEDFNVAVTTNGVDQVAKALKLYAIFMLVAIGLSLLMIIGYFIMIFLAIGSMASMN